jgi:hypothetical protein
MKSFIQKPLNAPLIRTLQLCLCLISAWMLVCGCKDSPKNVIKIKAFIDDKDVIKIQGNKVWWEHERGTFPGDPKGGNQPTFINGIA